jgi:hypothetical protein
MGGCLASTKVKVKVKVKSLIASEKPHKLSALRF